MLRKTLKKRVDGVSQKEGWLLLCLNRDEENREWGHLVEVASAVRNVEKEKTPIQVRKKKGIKTRPPL